MDDEKRIGQTAGFALLAGFVLALMGGGSSQLAARPLDDVIKSKYLRVFVYDNYPPYSFNGADGKLTGIDVEIGRKLAEALKVDIRFFVRDGDENVDDDLRNNVWKGHYLGGGVADVMLHVPFDKELAIRNNLVVLFGRYYTARMGLLTDPEKVGKSQTLAPFRYEKIGVEVDSLADFYLSSPSTFGGSLRSKVVRYRDFNGVMKGLQRGEVAGLMGPRGQLEAAVKTSSAITGKHYLVASPPFRGMSKPLWQIGMAVKHDSRDLGYKLGDVIERLRRSGELKAIFARYGLDYYAEFMK